MKSRLSFKPQDSKALWELAIMRQRLKRHRSVQHQGQTGQSAPTVDSPLCDEPSPTDSLLDHLLGTVSFMPE